jgi:hypothetical protein
LYSFKPKTKYVEDLLDTDVSDDTEISDDSSSEEEGDEYDDDPYVEDTIDTIEATEETVFRVETNGLLSTDTINCEVCGQARGKRGYKIHLAACKKKALNDKVNL